MQSTVIDVINLTKKYDNVTAIKNISFKVFQREIFSLIGPNGSGKTTTIEILECLRKPTSGKASILGFDVTTEDRMIKKKIGVLPQEFMAFDRLTVEENVKLIERIYKIKADIRDILEQFGLWELRKRKYGELSGGNKRKVGICMAIINNPDILFLDEPTTGLDPKSRKECWQSIKEINKSGTTIFLTSHYMEEVERLCNRVALIANGCIIAADEINNLISKYSNGIKVIINGYVNEILYNIADKVYYNENYTIAIFKSRKEAISVITELFENGYEFKIKEPSLEDVFLHLVGKRINEEGFLNDGNSNLTYSFN